MVFVWSNLSRGEPHFTIAQVALNDTIMVIALIAVPILIQVHFNSGLANLLNRWRGVAHCIAGPSALIGASKGWYESAPTRQSIPTALLTSLMNARSLSLTRTPPMPRNPPSFAAFAALCATLTSNFR